ncbi:MAG: hypothetical protein QNJ78_11510 [Gammaproteobacteria bacterium]|nr:hypothetical protein [Gammaproteobacteria bacterium]
MQKPTQADIHEALAAAQELLGRTGPAEALGHYLLYLHDRNHNLEAIAEVAERFIRFGLPETEHARLVALLETLREETRTETDKDTGEFGLE